MFLSLSTKEALGFLSIVFLAVGYSCYFWDIYKGRTRPHVFSWLVWGLITLIVYFAQRSGHAGPGAWTSIFGAVLYLVIAGLAVVWGEKDIKRNDWLALGIAVLAIPIWSLTGNPLWSVILVTFIDGLAFYPTFRKTYVKPYEETLFLYFMDTLRLTISIIAMDRYSVVNVLYPFFLVFADGSFIVMALWRRYRLARRLDIMSKTVLEINRPFT